MRKKEKSLWVFNTVTCVLLWMVILCGFTNIIDTAEPPGTGDPSEADDNMRRIQAGFQEILAVEHDVDLTGTEITGDGKHTAITCDSVVSAGAISGTTVTGSGAISGTSISGSTTLSITGNGTIGGTLGVTGVATVAKGSLLASSDAPTTDAMIANKKYVDDQITANADPSYTGGESHTHNGGLIIKMGKKSPSGSGEETLTFGSAFPTGIISVVATVAENSVQTADMMTYTWTTAGFKYKSPSAKDFGWIAIGY